MEETIKRLLCLIAVILIMIGERGVPVRFEKYDIIKYWITYNLILIVM